MTIHTHPHENRGKYETTNSPQTFSEKVKPNIHTKKLLLGFQKLQFYGYFVAHSSVN